jgi:hypothetical protein
MSLTNLPLQFTKCALYKVSNIKILHVHVFHLSHTETKYPAYHNVIDFTPPPPPPLPTNMQDICLSSAANIYTSSLEQTMFDSRSGYRHHWLMLPVDFLSSSGEMH